MKHKYLSWQAALPALLLALSAQAHDPAEHMKGAEKPDCTAMRDMDHSKMDMNDPLMQAMMQKCKDEMNQDEAASDDSKDKPSESNEDDDAKSSSKHDH